MVFVHSHVSLPEGKWWSVSVAEGKDWCFGTALDTSTNQLQGSDLLWDRTATIYHLRLCVACNEKAGGGATPYVLSWQTCHPLLMLEILTLGSTLIEVSCISFYKACFVANKQDCTTMSRDLHEVELYIILAVKPFCHWCTISINISCWLKCRVFLRIPSF